MSEVIKWRPIHEIHEDYGECVAWNGDYMVLVHVCNLDFDEKDYVCFCELPKLTEEDVQRFELENAKEWATQ